MTCGARLGKVFVSLLVFLGGMFQDQFLFPCPKIQHTILSVFVGVKSRMQTHNGTIFPAACWPMGRHSLSGKLLF